MRRLVLLLAAVLTATLLAPASAGVAAHCGTGLVHVGGTVLDRETGAPLDEVTSVGIEGTTDAGDPYSDGEGTTVPGSTWQTCLPPGEYSFSFMADSYLPRSFGPFRIDTDVSRDVRLQPRPRLVGQVVSRATRTGVFTSIGIEEVFCRPDCRSDGEASNADGTFSIPVEPGWYIVSFGADGHWMEWYDNAPRRRLADLIRVRRFSGTIDLGRVVLQPCGRPEICVRR